MQNFKTTKAFIEFLKKEMQEKKISANQIEKNTGITRQTICYWLKKNIKSVKLENMYRVLDFLEKIKKIE